MEAELIDLRGFTFSVIYSVDVPGDTYLRGYMPSNFKRNGWQITEDGESEVFPDDRKARHRKYCALLDWESFVKLTEDQFLTAEQCQTMGMLGGPGIGYGWAPAVSFNAEDERAYQNAYVCPIPPDPEPDNTPILLGFPEDIADRVWDFEEIERLMWEIFDGYGCSVENYVDELKESDGNEGE